MVGGRRGGLLQNLTFPIIFWVMKPGSTQGSGTGELGGGTLWKDLAKCLE